MHIRYSFITAHKTQASYNENNKTEGKTLPKMLSFISHVGKLFHSRAPNMPFQVT